MEKKQTAVEWLIDSLPQIDWEHPHYGQLVQNAKQMEKQQITQAFSDGKYYSHDYFDEQNPYANQAQNYYNETYNKNL